MSTRYYDLSEDTIREVNDFISEYVTTPVRIDYAFIGDNKQKSMIIIKKVSDVNKHLMKKDVVISINEDLYSMISDDESVKVLLSEAFAGLMVNAESGKIKIEKPNFITTEGVIKEFQLETVKRAKDIEKAALSTMKDKEKESEAINIGE